jgi:hypothetical protein
MTIPIKPEENRRADGTFGPGNNANPNGRPKGVSFTERIREIFLNEPEKFEETCRYFINDPRMKDLLWKQIDGLPKQTTELTGKDEGPLKIIVEGINVHKDSTATETDGSN